VAIGGIKAENAKEVYEAGADCIAVISDIEHSPHIADRVQQYRVAFEKARGAGE
jgi:thiamine monophosphate synthase